MTQKVAMVNSNGEPEYITEVAEDVYVNGNMYNGHTAVFLNESDDINIFI